MSQNQISTISEFLLHAGTDYRVFDMARTIRPMSSQQFLDFENGTDCAHFPRSQHGWFGLVFWDKTRSQQQYIWFVKLPVDEQCKLVSAARDQFLQIIIDALGSQLEQTEQKNGQLPENPFTFVPNQHQLADFNSISRSHIGLGHSTFHALAWAYLQSPAVVDWQKVALQGLTDVVTELEQTLVAKTLVEHFDNYPQAVQFHLLISFENRPLPTSVSAMIVDWMARHDAHPQVWQHGLRALCQTKDSHALAAIDAFLACELRHNIDVLTVIAGRLWHTLSDGERLMRFMDQVAQADLSFGLFQGVFRDLVLLPELRQSMLTLLRNPNKPPMVTQAVGSLFSDTKQPG